MRIVVSLKKVALWGFLLLLIASMNLIFSHGCGNGSSGNGTRLKDENFAEDFTDGEKAQGENQVGDEEGKDYGFSPLFGGSEEIMILKNISFEELNGSERVVLEFVGQKANPGTGIPRYHTDYGSLPYLDLEGNVVAIEGTHWVDLTFNSSIADLSAPGGYVLVYTGPQDIRPGFKVIREVRFVNSYEDNTLILLVGLSKRAPYRLQELLNPPRLIIEVQK